MLNILNAAKSCTEINGASVIFNGKNITKSKGPNVIDTECIYTKGTISISKDGFCKENFIKRIKNNITHPEMKHIFLQRLESKYYRFSTYKVPLNGKAKSRSQRPECPIILIEITIFLTLF